MARIAESVAEVIAGEAGGRTRAARYNDMQHIASVIANRAQQLGVSPESVVQRQSEFNAYGKRMPGGTAALIGLAEQAMREVATEGPVTTATFYATPAAAKNLPKGLQSETKTASHRYFSDPQNRAIFTADGLKKPAITGRAQLGRPLDTYDAASLPTPTPRDVTLAAAMPARPMTATPNLSAMSPRQEASLADRLGNLFGVSTAAASERMPSGLPSSVPAYSPNVQSRPAPSLSSMPTSGGLLTATSLGLMSAPRSMVTGNERARSAPVTPSYSPTPSIGTTTRITAPTPMGPTQSFGVSQRIDAGNLGTPAISVSGLTGGSPTHKMGAASQPGPGIMGGAMPTSGGLLTDRSLAAMNAPAVNGISGNERALGLYSGQQLLDADVKAQRAKTFGPAPAAAALPATIKTAAPTLGALPTAFNPALQNAPAYQPPAVVTAPKVARLTPAPAPLPAPVTIAPAPKVASVPRTPVAAVTRNVPSSSMALGYASSPSLSTGLGLPSVPSAPAPAGLLGSMFGGNGAFSNRRNGALVGGLLGSALGGPVGGLLGAVLGRAAGNSSYGTPSHAAQAALDAGWDGFSAPTVAQSAAARNAPAGGGSAGWGGGGGLLGGLGSFFGGLLGGGAGSKAGVGSYGNSPNNAGYSGGVSANMGKSGGGVSSGGKKK